MARVTLSDQTGADVDDILDRLLDRAGLRVASDYAQRFAAQIDLLTDFPAAGTPKPEYGPQVRQLVVAPYLMLYRIDRDRVLILRVLDGRRRITRRLVSGRG